MNPIPDKHFSKFGRTHDKDGKPYYPNGEYLIKLESGTYVAVTATNHYREAEPDVGIMELRWTVFEDWGGTELWHNEIAEIALIKLEK